MHCQHMLCDVMLWSQEDDVAQGGATPTPVHKGDVAMAYEK